MIQAIVTDLSRVLLFPKDDAYTDGLNELNNKLLVKNPDYNFWDYFKMNQKLLDYYRQLNTQVPTFVFTSETIQEHPAVKQEIDDTFSEVLSALDFGLQKSDPRVYTAIATHLQTPAGEILFIDDSDGNITQARIAGMQALRFESNQQTIAYINTALGR